MIIVAQTHNGRFVTEIDPQLPLRSSCPDLFIHPEVSHKNKLPFQTGNN